MDDKILAEMTARELRETIAAGVKAGLLAVMIFGTAQNGEIRDAARRELARRKAGEPTSE